MAFWPNHYSSYPDLVDGLVRAGTLKSPHLIKAFKSIDRIQFVPPALIDQAYGNFPLDIGHGQTISQPTTVAIMLELLQPKAGQNILDVGSGSGWTTALLATVVGVDGRIVGTEIKSGLVRLGQNRLEKMKLRQATIHYTPGRLGYVKAAPYDRILVSASADSIPDELIKQLKSPGQMVVPVKNSLFKIVKDPFGRIKSEEHYGFVFVPLLN